MTKPTIAILTGLLALGLTVAWASGKTTHTAPTGTVTGAATALHVHSTSMALVLRLSGNHLLDVTVPAHSAVTSSDGHGMASSSIRLGDRLTVSKSGTIRDLSQKLVTIKGIVSIAPLQGGDPLIVQPASAEAVLIDLSTQTRYKDTSHETAKLEQLEDADQVAIQGLFDAGRGEMTQANTVTRTGPVHKKTSTKA